MVYILDTAIGDYTYIWQPVCELWSVSSSLTGYKHLVNRSLIAHLDAMHLVTHTAVNMWLQGYTLLE